jgi:hypothetical protein
MWVNAVQIREGRMSDEDVAALGGPDAAGIPAASIGSVATTPVVATVEAQVATLVTGTYAKDPTATVDAATKTITIPQPPGTRFYRLSGSAKINSAQIQANAIVLKYQ